MQQRGCRVGIGSGFTLKTSDEASLDLITLYTATQSERESRSAEQRVGQSRLLAASTGPAEQLAGRELLPAVKDLCRTLDGFVYVVDATAAVTDSLYLQLIFSFNFSVDLLFLILQSVISSS